MEITEKHVFIFEVSASTKEEAIRKLLSELPPQAQSEFTLISHDVDSIQPLVASVPPEVLDLRIQTLVEELGGVVTPQQIKKWTKLDYVENNYTGIITALEELKSKKDDTAG